jgi:hypothetical protein
MILGGAIKDKEDRIREEQGRSVKRKYILGANQREGTN